MNRYFFALFLFFVIKELFLTEYFILFLAEVLSIRLKPLFASETGIVLVKLITVSRLALV